MEATPEPQVDTVETKNDQQGQVTLDARAAEENMALTLRPEYQSEEQLREELKRLRERGEVAEKPFDIERIRELQDQYRVPVRRADLLCNGGLYQAVEITRDELDSLGTLLFVHSSGKAVSLGALDNTKDRIILLPRHFGDAADETAYLMGDEHLT